MSQQSAEMEYVGFWPRFGASLVDSLLTVCITIPLLVSIYGAGILESEEMIHGPAHVLIAYVLPPVIVMLFWIKVSTTPGKMLITARIVDQRTGARPSAGQFLIRYLGYFVSALPLCLGYLWAGFDARKQAWHDKMAGTVVVRGKAGPAEPARVDQTAT